MIKGHPWPSYELSYFSCRLTASCNKFTSSSRKNGIAVHFSREGFSSISGNCRTQVRRLNDQMSGTVMQLINGKGVYSRQQIDKARLPAAPAGYDST